MIIYTSLQFWIYEMFRFNRLKYHRPDHQEGQAKKLTIPESLVATVVSTGIATFVINPLDILITRF